MSLERENRDESVLKLYRNNNTGKKYQTDWNRVQPQDTLIQGVFLLTRFDTRSPVEDCWDFRSTQSGRESTVPDGEGKSPKIRPSFSFGDPPKLVLSLY